MRHEHLSDIRCVEGGIILFIPMVGMGAGIEHGQVFGKFTITVEVCAQDALVLFVCRLQDCSSGSVAKDYCYVPSPGGEIDSKRLLLTAYHQDVFVGACADELVGYAQGINKAAALVPNVQCPHFLHLQCPLHQYTTAWEIVVRTQCGEDDEVDLLRSGTCPFDGYFGCLDTHGSCSLLRAMPITPLPDTRPFLYPFVTGIHVLREVLVGDHVFREVFADAGDFCFGHGVGVESGWRIVNSGIVE